MTAQSETSPSPSKRSKRGGQCQDYIVAEGDASLYYCTRRDGHSGPHRAEVEWENAPLDSEDPSL